MCDARIRSPLAPLERPSLAKAKHFRFTSGQPPERRRGEIVLLSPTGQGTLPEGTYWEGPLNKSHSSRLDEIFRSYFDYLNAKQPIFGVSTLSLDGFW
ncbi:hypothetical protein QTI66_38570 [Variovorax sp. J22R133]|uniref:hypothetical protein n=1 Tax=Variovorax brevis TaxID=3053503 RepID=UPI002578FAFE|nr:hypothetical protein [Variovorax sp. J22R133]MDM0117994.1 hypothetical protein [Variovorax sp. J22R133]